MYEQNSLPKEKVNIESVVRLESDKYNQGTKNAQLIHEIRNTAENWLPIINKIKSGQARDISDEPKAINKACFIFGSGPSFDDSVQYLKEWEGGSICTTSHALTLMYHGVEPSHILILDPFCRWDEIKGVDWSKTKTKLIIHPGCYPDLIQNWPNEILLYRQNNARPDSFYSEEQMKMFTERSGDFRLSTFKFLIRTAITIFACSPPMQLFAGEVLGYEKFFLMGCDFAYHSDKDRFTDYTIDLSKWDYNKLIEEAEKIKNSFNKEEWDLYWDRFNSTFSNKIPIIPNWIEHKHPFDPNEKDLVLTNSGLYSKAIHVYYLKNLISAWRLCSKTMYTTDHGAMTQVPFADIKAVIKRKGDYPLQHKWFIDETCDKYLATCGAYVLETSQGNSFIESMYPEKELPDFMKSVMRRYKCTNCLNQLTVNPVVFKLKYSDKVEEYATADEVLFNANKLKISNIKSEIEIVKTGQENHTGDECPICHVGKLVREIDVDIEKNMERIMKYIPKNVELAPRPEQYMINESAIQEVKELMNNKKVSSDDSKELLKRFNR